MSLVFRRTAAVLLVVLGPTAAVVTWWRVTAPEPPIVSRATTDDLDPLVERRIGQAVAAVRSRPRDAAAWAQLAMVYQAHRFTDEAEACYRQTLAFDATDAPGWYHLARSLARRGAYDEAVACIDRAIALEPAYPPLHWQRGDWLLELGRLDEAADAYRRVIEIEPRESAGPHGVARVFLQQRRYDDVIALLGPVVNRDEADLYGRHLLGRAYRGLGREEEADRYARSSEVVPPLRYDPWAWLVANLRTGYTPSLDRAEAMVESGQAEAAIPILLEAREAYGSDGRTLNTLAGAYAAAGRPHEAIRTLEELLENNRPHFRPYMNLASQQERIGDIDGALASVRAAIALTPHAQAMAEEGRLLLRKNDMAAAAAAFERAVAAGADQPEDRVALAHILVRVGRIADAIVQYRAALDDAPDHAPAYAGLAIAFASIAEFRAARRELDRARVLAPGDPEVAQAQRRIDEMERAGG